MQELKKEEITRKLYSLIPLFCFLVGNPNASINSSFLPRSRRFS